MIVFINDKEISIFEGARLQDAVLAFSKVDYQLLRTGEKVILDRFGNSTEPDGPIVDGQKFTIKFISEL